MLESEVIKPFVLCLLDPEEPPIPDAQFVKALDVVESWMVRRMLVRATTKNYNQVVAELVAQVRRSDRANAGDVIESYLTGQSSESRYWPDDAEMREELGAFARLSSSWSRTTSHGARGHRGSPARLEGWKAGSWR